MMSMDLLLGWLLTRIVASLGFWPGVILGFVDQVLPYGQTRFWIEWISGGML